MAWTPPKHARLPLWQNPTGTSLIVLTTALLALGTILVISALSSVKEVEVSHWWAKVSYRHMFFAAASVIVLATLWRVDYHWFASPRRCLDLRLIGSIPLPALALVMVALVLGGLVFVPGIGHKVGVYARWIRIPAGSLDISLQPSELIKLTLMIFLAGWLTHEKTNPRSGWTCLACGIVIGACVGLIITQDFGTAAVVGISAAVTMIMAGVPWYYLVSFIPPAAAAFYFLVILVPYRYVRLLSMLDPWGTFQSKEALMAIISGGWYGKGLGWGMLKHGYLPEDSTDYIFSILCEELGLVGAALLILLLCVWMFQARRASLKAADRFGMVLAGSMGFVVSLQSLLHIGVNLAVLPPKGIGLPFISAGGTSMIIMAAAVSLIISVIFRQEFPDL